MSLWTHISFLYCPMIDIFPDSLLVSHSFSLYLAISVALCVTIRVDENHSHDKLLAKPHGKVSWLLLLCRFSAERIKVETKTIFV